MLWPTTRHADFAFSRSKNCDAPAPLGTMFTVSEDASPRKSRDHGRANVARDSRRGHAFQPGLLLIVFLLFPNVLQVVRAPVANPFVSERFLGDVAEFLATEHKQIVTDR